MPYDCFKCYAVSRYEPFIALNNFTLSPAVAPVSSNTLDLPMTNNGSRIISLKILRIVNGTLPLISKFILIAVPLMNLLVTSVPKPEGNEQKLVQGDNRVFHITVKKGCNT
uniref:Uncharacterized protein n=1 Tax=Glossina palpalis gambiensis TaxID=67801 RepID=A0A1B0BXJ7_9MUSC